MRQQNPGHPKLPLRALAILGCLSLVFSGAAFASGATQCDGQWNLTCISPAGCTYVSGYEDGRVVGGDQVYWNLHTPSGSWTTSPSGCNTVWYDVQSNGCPTKAYNCYSQTYSIEHSLPDLIITNVSLSSTSVESGDDVVVYYDVKNIGTETVTPRYQERFLLKPSSGAAYEAYVGSTYGTDISPGSSVSLAKTVEVFGEAGSYTLQVEADFGGALGEESETNNVTGTSLTVTAPSGPQLSIIGMLFNPGGSNGWTFGLQNCTQGSPCSRDFEVVSTGTSSASVYITDNSDAGTDVSDDCPGSLSPGSSCTITIEHTLPSMTAKENGGTLSLSGAVPSQSSYKICIEDDDWLCR